MFFLLRPRLARFVRRARGKCNPNSAMLFILPGFCHETPAIGRGAWANFCYLVRLVRLAWHASDFKTAWPHATCESNRYLSVHSLISFNLHDFKGLGQSLCTILDGHLQISNATFRLWQFTGSKQSATESSVAMA